MLLQKFMLSFLSPDHIFISSQFENQEVSLYVYDTDVWLHR